MGEEGRDQVQEQALVVRAAGALAGLPSHPLVGVRPEAWAKVADLLKDARSKATRDAYAADLFYLWTWAEATYRQPAAYPVAASWVAEFIADHSGEGELSPAVREALLWSGSRRPGGKSLATLLRRLAALSMAHQLLGFADANPCRSHLVHESVRAARRRNAESGRRQKRAKPLLLEDLERLVATCEGPDADLVDLRDRALLLLGWASGGRRRSEIVAANVEDLERLAGEWVLHLRRSKTDQEGEGSVKPLKGKVGRAVWEWLNAAGITEGPIFRPVLRCGEGRRRVVRVRKTRLRGAVVAEIVRRRARLAGVADPELCCGHSLRAGFVTSAGLKGHYARGGDGLDRASDRGDGSALSASGGCVGEPRGGVGQRGRGRGTEAISLNRPAPGGRGQVRYWRRPQKNGRLCNAGSSRSQRNKPAGA